MEELKNMKENLMCVVGNQINGNLSTVDTKELGEAVDMIKDLSEAIYYCTITEAMEKNNKEQPMYYTSRPIMTSPTWERDMDRDYGRMYYGGGNYGGNSSSGGNSGGGQGGNSSSYYGGDRGYYLPDHSRTYESRPMMIDPREGRSGNMRRNYMEAKEMHKGKEVQMKELEKYMQELSGDITDMIKDASPEEKAMLQQKIATLANKIT